MCRMNSQTFSSASPRRQMNHQFSQLEKHIQRYAESDSNEQKIYVCRKNELHMSMQKRIFYLIQLFSKVHADKMSFRCAFLVQILLHPPTLQYAIVLTFIPLCIITHHSFCAIHSFPVIGVITF